MIVIAFCFGCIVGASWTLVGLARERYKAMKESGMIDYMRNPENPTARELLVRSLMNAPLSTDLQDAIEHYLETHPVTL
jgi:hypothetical protein